LTGGQRKGATPAQPGQWGFVGGSMGDISVILRGVESQESAALLYSTVHGAGRVMSRMRAKKGTHEVVHTLQPRIVVMAGGDEYDPYKD
jgi:RNA-splicing ligase RtcB